MEQIREVLEIYLITGGIFTLVLKSRKNPPFAAVTQSLGEEGSGFTCTKFEQVPFYKVGV